MRCNDYSLKYLMMNLYEYDRDHVRTIDIPRPFDIITEIISGNVTFSDTEGNCVEACEGEVVFIPMGTAYTMKWAGTAPSNLTVHYQFEREQEQYTMQKIEGVRFPFSEIPDSELLRMARFYELYAECEPRIKKEKPTAGYDGRIRAAAEFIRSNYNVDFNIEQLADMCHLSPSRFHYLFKKSVGYTAIDYKNKIKTDIAMQLLISTSLSIEEISDRLNFNSSIYFRRVFKKFAGMSATQYRTVYFKQEV